MVFTPQVQGRFMVAKLVIKDESSSERIHDLVDEVTTIGRSSTNTIQITDAKSSRSHFRIERTGEDFKVVDLGSTNGTKLNGEKVTAQLLKQGDVLRVGQTTFAFKSDAPAVMAAEPKSQADVMTMQAKDLPVVAASSPAPTSSQTVPPDPQVMAAALAAAMPAPAPVATLEPTMISAPSKEASAPKYVLTILEGKNAGATFDLGHEPLTMGRSSSNKVKVDDDAASNYHAEISKAPIGYVISDLGSTNGTKVKARGAFEFEKIVKTPLAPGMQVRIGKTVLEFRNVGAPSAEDQLFGTVVLDESKVKPGDAIAPRPEKKRSLAPVLLGVAALVIFTAVVTLVVKLLPKPDPTANDGPKKAVPSPAANLLENGDFSKEPDDQGNPPGWRINKEAPEVRVVLDKDAERDASKAEGAQRGLRISKAGAMPTRTVVETMDTYPVDPGKVYELSGALRNDGDGIFGLRIVWQKASQGGERTLEDHLVLSGTQQDWKDRPMERRPPAWAERARVGVFAEGREGKASFDNLVFREKPDAKLPEAPSISFNAVTVTFEGSKGVFSATAAGQPAVEMGLIELLGKDGKPLTSIVSAFDTKPVEEGGRVTWRGQVFDFVQQQPTAYMVAALKGSGGVKMNFAFTRPTGESAQPQLSFCLVGPVALGGADLTAAGASQKLNPRQGGKFDAVTEAHFNPGAQPQLYLNFAAPVKLEIVCEGERRWLRVPFEADLGVDIAPENVGVKQQFINDAKDLDEALSAKQWSQVHKLADAIERRYGGSNPEAKDKARKARDTLESAFKPVKEELDKQVDMVQKFPNAADAALKFTASALPPWQGTPKEMEFTQTKAKIEAIKNAGAKDQRAQEAQGLLDRAKKAYASKLSYNIAYSFCKRVAEGFADTPAGAEAKDLLPRYEKDNEKEKLLLDIFNRVKVQAEPFRRAGDFQNALKTIENDPLYKKHSHELKDLQEMQDYLEDLRKKAQP